MREYAELPDTEFIDLIISGNSGTKKTPRSKTVRIDGKVYEKYFDGMSEEKISGIIEKALDMFFKNSENI